MKEYITLRISNTFLSLAVFSLLLSFSLNSQCVIDPTISNVSADNTTCVNPGSDVVLTVTGDLNDATDWNWYSGSCGGTFEGTGPSIIVNPSTTTTYYVRGEVCAPMPPCESILIEVDDEDPVITVGPVIEDVEPGACYYISDNLTFPTVTDNCTVDTIYNNADLLLFPGVHTITWTAIDQAGNIAQETQQVTVEDNENPSIDAPADVLVSADANCEANGVSLGSPLTVDNCSVDNITNDAPATFPIGQTVVTWTAEDPSGNIGADQQIVTVIDNTNPIIIDLPVDIVVNNDPGVCNAVVVWVEPTADDNCPDPTITQVAGDPSGSAFPVGTTTISYQAMDDAGNTTTESFTVTVVDNEDPAITPPTDITTSADGFCSASPALGSPTANDNCGVANISNDAPSSFSLGTTSVTWTVTDVNGNQEVATQNVTVVDNTPPSIIDLPNSQTVNNNLGDCGQIVFWPAPTVDDNCPGASILQTAGLASGSFFPIGTMLIEYRATDASGNTTRESFTITVIDAENPTITAPADITVSANSNCVVSGLNLGSPVTNDNCSVESITNNAPSLFSLGTTTVIWTVTDGSGNTSTDTQNVIVTDDTNPIINAPSDMKVNVDAASCEATIANLGSPITDDNCTVANFSNDAPATFPVGTTSVTWTVEDGSGNTSTDTQVITVIDNVYPTIIDLPSDISTSTDLGECSAIVSWIEPTADDNCTGVTLSQTTGLANGDPFPKGITIVEYTATDASGNITSETFTVTVIDNENPTITSPADVTVSANSNCVVTGLNLGSPVTGDNCSVGSITNDAPSLFSVGTTVVTWTVTDDSGNTSTDTQNIIVIDDTDPTIIAPSNMIVNVDAASCEATISDLGTPVTDDNCSVANFSNDAPATFPVGTTSVTWTVEDGSGNTSTDTQVITVIDNIYPTIIDLPADINTSTDPGECSAIVSWIEPTADDNCPGVTLSQTTGLANGDPFPKGITIVEYTATDASGNITSETFTVTVIDNENPTVTAPADVTVSANDFCTSFGVFLGSATTADNCSVASVTNDAPAIYTLGTTVVTWTVTDDSGNTSTDTQNIIVVDDTDPTIIAPGDMTVNVDPASCEATISDLGTPFTDDNCSIANVSNDAPATFPVGMTTVTWTLEDGSGNTSTDTQIITVVDNINPIIVDLPSDRTVPINPWNCLANVSWTEPTVDDNCPGATITQTAGPTNGGSATKGISIVEYTATDAAGNTVTETFTITVVDNENPTITAPDDVTVSANNFCSAFGVDLGSPVTGDNCSVESVTNDAPPIYSLGTTVVTWTVTDGSGNTSAATQNVIVIDDADPTITAPSDITVNVDPASCEATINELGSPATADNCSVADVSNNAPATFPVGITTVTWTVEDGSGNTSTDTQKITVIDNINPVILDLPNDTIVSNDSLLCGAEYTWVEPSADDNCPGVTIMQTGGFANGDTIPVGVNTIIYTATDASGNSISSSFTVTVIDDENPTIIAPADTIVEANHFCTALNVVLENPITDDNCGIRSVINDAPLIFGMDTTIITWTVTDEAGNTASATQLVIVADSTAPVVTAPLPVTAYVDENCEIEGSTIELGWPHATDNCAVDTIYNDLPDTLTTGKYIVTWFAEDAHGNIGTATQTLTLIDTIPPTPVLTDTVITLSPEGPILVFGEDIDLGSFDNCGIAEVILDQEVFDCDDLGVNTIGVRVIDVNGNVTDTSIVVEVLESGIDLDFDGIDDACDDDVNTTVVEVPSGFTPNGDGINDLFVITALSNYSKVELYVYNRYGNLVYENQQYENNWDGTSSKNGMELPDGTYFYVLKLDGQAEKNGYVYINRTL